MSFIKPTKKQITKEEKSEEKFPENSLPQIESKTKQHSLSTPDIDKLIIKVSKCEIIDASSMKQICKLAKSILENESNMVNLSTPITVCGDIHGQFYDLLELFNIGGYLPETNYLFLGDYVDRGYYSVESITLLLLYKIRYSKRVTILRGNHECRVISQVYGFYDECLKKYGDPRIWQDLTDVFDYLPLTSLINEEIFCMHGGLSPEMKLISQVNELDRVQAIPHEGMMCDLLWSDPIDIDDKKNDVGWYPSPRGCSYNWSEKISKWFNNKNGLTCVVRAHQLVMNGYNWTHNKNILTVFSAANYCYRCGNQGAVMELSDDSEYTFLQYDAAPRKDKVEIKKTVPDYFL